MPTPNYVDALLLEALRRDDDKALTHLFEQYYNRLFRVGLKTGASSTTVQECIQLIFIDLWRYRQSLSDIESFEAYLITALKRRIAKTAETTQHLKIEESTAQFLTVEAYESVLIEQQASELTRERIHNALDKLTNRQKEVVMLRFFEELTYDEIAEKTQLQKDTLYKILHEAIGRLKGLITPPQ
jgi:RNA polymerase sigma factor (sigma-70 family)